MSADDQFLFAGRPDGDRTPWERCCQKQLPDLDNDFYGHIHGGALWRCPECGRRWRLLRTKLLAPVEGIGIVGPDGSRYWRAGWMRFLGRIGT